MCVCRWVWAKHKMPMFGLKKNKTNTLFSTLYKVNNIFGASHMPVSDHSSLHPLKC